MQLGLDTNAVVRMDRLGKVDSWVQAAEDKAAKENNNKENDNREDLNIASDIIYIG
jgi:hypothetical protein